MQIKTDNECLSDYFSTLPREVMTPLISKITLYCKIPRQTFFNWKYGVCRIPDLYKDKIEEIIGCKIFSELNNL